MSGSPKDPGLIPRLCQGLFKQIEQHKTEGKSFNVEVSYMEIYNEKVNDLLNR